MLLVQPLAEYREALERIPGKYDCRIIHKAVGSRCGQAEISVDTGGTRTSPRSAAAPARLLPAAR